MPYEPPPDLAALSLAEIAALAETRKLPPLERWSPEHTDDSRMRIAADGRWYHEGGEITRPAMIRAFASLLTRDADGRRWLVTPTARSRSKSRTPSSSPSTSSRRAATSPSA